MGKVEFLHDDEDAINRFHDSFINYYGEGDPKAVGWYGEDSQKTRFDVLCKVWDLTDCTVLDVGCGFWHLYEFIKERFNVLKYTWIDINPRIIKYNEEKFSETNFILWNFFESSLGSMDYILASWALANRVKNYEEVHYKMIEKMYKEVRVWVAFNMLDVEHCEKWVEIVGYNRHEMLEKCKKITKNIKLVDGYLNNDFTIYMYK